MEGGLDRLWLAGDDTAWSVSGEQAERLPGSGPWTVPAQKRRHFLVARRVFSCLQKRGRKRIVSEEMFKQRRTPKAERKRPCHEPALKAERHSGATRNEIALSSLSCLLAAAKAASSD